MSRQNDTSPPRRPCPSNFFDRFVELPQIDQRFEPSRRRLHKLTYLAETAAEVFECVLQDTRMFGSGLFRKCNFQIPEPGAAESSDREIAKQANQSPHRQRGSARERR